MHSCENRMFEEFRKLSAKIGRNPLLVQGCGVNTSIKHHGLLWVKGSGAWLARAENENIFMAVHLDALRQAVLDGKEVSPSLYKAGDSKLKPSIETTLHALMPQKVVLHVHSINAIATAVIFGGKHGVSRLLDGLNWKWIPYRRPGVPLTLAIRAVVAETPD